MSRILAIAIVSAALGASAVASLKLPGLVVGNQKPAPRLALAHARTTPTVVRAAPLPTPVVHAPARHAFRPPAVVARRVPAATARPAARPAPARKTTVHVKRAPIPAPQPAPAPATPPAAPPVPVAPQPQAPAQTGHGHGHAYGHSKHDRGHASQGKPQHEDKHQGHKDHGHGDKGHGHGGEGEGQGEQHGHGQKH